MYYTNDIHSVTHSTLKIIEIDIDNMIVMNKLASIYNYDTIIYHTSTS